MNPPRLISAGWLGAMSDEQLSGWAKQHRITPDMPVALYGNDDDNQTVKTRLEKRVLPTFPS